jgi:hypothetical protein
VQYAEERYQTEAQAASLRIEFGIKIRKAGAQGAG